MCDILLPQPCYKNCQWHSIVLLEKWLSWCGDGLRLGLADLSNCLQGAKSELSLMFIQGRRIRYIHIPKSVNVSDAVEAQVCFVAMLACEVWADEAKFLALWKAVSTLAYLHHFVSVHGTSYKFSRTAVSDARRWWKLLLFLFPFPLEVKNTATCLECTWELEHFTWLEIFVCSGIVSRGPTWCTCRLQRVVKHRHDEKRAMKVTKLRQTRSETSIIFVLILVSELVQYEGALVIWYFLSGNVQAIMRLESVNMWLTYCL